MARKRSISAGSNIDNRQAVSLYAVPAGSGPDRGWKRHNALVLPAFTDSAMSFGACLVRGDRGGFPARRRRGLRWCAGGSDGRDGAYFQRPSARGSENEQSKATAGRKLPEPGSWLLKEKSHGCSGGNHFNRGGRPLGRQGFHENPADRRRDADAFRQLRRRFDSRGYRELRGSGEFRL